MEALVGAGELNEWVWLVADGGMPHGEGEHR
jgi:hypothetical protein